MKLGNNDVEKEYTQEAKGKRRIDRKPKSSLPEAEKGTTDIARRGWNVSS